jgi:hypothetical protein
VTALLGVPFLRARWLLDCSRLTGDLYCILPGPAGVPDVWRYRLWGPPP